MGHACVRVPGGSEFAACTGVNETQWATSTHQGSPLHGKHWCVTGTDNQTGAYHTIPYQTRPYHTIPYHTIRYHNMPYRTVPLHIQLTISYHAMPNHTTITYRTVAHLADHAGCYRRRTCTRRTFGSTSSFILAGPKIVIGHTMSVPN